MPTDTHYVPAEELERLRDAERERDRLRRIANVQQMCITALVWVAVMLIAVWVWG